MPTTTPYRRYVDSDDLTPTEVRVNPDHVVVTTDAFTGRPAYLSAAKTRELIESLSEALFCLELINDPYGARPSAQFPAPLIP